MSSLNIFGRLQPVPVLMHRQVRRETLIKQKKEKINSSVIQTTEKDVVLKSPKLNNFLLACMHIRELKMSKNFALQVFVTSFMSL